MEKREDNVLKKVKFKDSIVTSVTLVNMTIFLCASLLCVFVIMFVNIAHHYQENTKMMDVYISNTVNSLDNMLKDMGRVSLICFSDKETQEIMKSFSGYTEKKQMESVDYFQQLYTSLITIRNDIQGVYMFDRNELIYYQDSRLPSVRRNSEPQAFLEKINELEKNAEDISGCYLLFDELPDFMHYSEFDMNDIERRYSIYLVRPVRSFRPHEVIGYIAILTSIRNIQKVMEQYLESGLSYSLLCADGTVACCQNKKKIGRNLFELESELYKKLDSNKGHFLSSYDGRMCLISYKVSEYSGLSLITAKPFKDIILEMKSLLEYCCMIFLVSALLTLICIWKITKRNLRRITEFAKNLSCFEPSNLKQRYAIEKRDEIGQLQCSFNYMMDIINDLVVSEYEGKMKLQQAELTEQKLSMLYLKSQINPHFLYNTLDMIRIKAELNHDKEVSNMLMKLVVFYRLSTKVDSSWVTLKHEVEMLDAYMKLCCYRYPGLSYHTEIQEHLLEQGIPNFVLQPLVENSLVHGLKNKGYVGTVELKIFHERDKNDEMQILIMDDGIGMRPDILEQLNDASKYANPMMQDENPESKHIGIVNVRNRLQFFYGEGCQMEFKNKTDGGLCITIRLRIEK